MYTTYEVRRSEDQVGEQLVLALAQTLRGTTVHPLRTYEDGVATTLRWLRGESDEPPFGLADVES
jgi:hypothetical protein